MDTTTFAGRIDQIYPVRLPVAPAQDAHSVMLLPGWSVYVRGWAVAPPRVGFALALDETYRFPCEANLPRADIAEAIGASAEISGFEAFFDLPELDLGRYDLTLLAITGSKTKAIDVVPVTLVDIRPRTTLKPAAGGLLNVERIFVGTRRIERRERALATGPEDIITIEGWAVNGFDSRAGAALYAVIDDREAIPVTYGRERSDVVATLGPQARYCGFRAVVDRGAFTGQPHILRMVIVAHDGSAVACADSFALCVDGTPSHADSDFA